MEARSLRFAATARALGQAARAQGFDTPVFRSPPRLPGRVRTIKRHANGTATVSVLLRNRPWTAVVADMVDGFVTVNGAERAGELRDLLWGAIESIDLVAPAETAGPKPSVLPRAA